MMHEFDGRKADRVWGGRSGTHPGRRLRQLVDVHKNKPIIILGNSASLNELDLSLLNRAITIGVQRILRVYEPTYVLIADNEVIKQESERLKACAGKVQFIFAPEHMNAETRKFYDGPWISRGRRVPGADLMNKNQPLPIPLSLNSGFEAVGIAYRMGARCIAIAGIDLWWPSNRPTHCFGDGKSCGCRLSGTQAVYNAFITLRRMLKGHGIDLLSVSPWKTPLSSALGHMSLIDFIHATHVQS